MRLGSQCYLHHNPSWKVKGLPQSPWHEMKAAWTDIFQINLSHYVCASGGGGDCHIPESPGLCVRTVAYKVFLSRWVSLPTDMCLLEYVYPSTFIDSNFIHNDWQTFLGLGIHEAFDCLWSHYQCDKLHLNPHTLMMTAETIKSFVYV